MVQEEIMHEIPTPRSYTKTVQAIESLEKDASTTYSNTSRQPWLEDAAYPWSALRIRVAKVLLSGYTEFAVTLIILLNFGLIIYEVNEEALCHPKFSSNMDACPTSHTNISWLGSANFALLATYSIEAIIRMFAFRRAYFQTTLNLFDLGLCVAGWLAVFIDSEGPVRISWLRIFRCCRIAKAAQFGTHIHELRLLLDGFIGCMRAMFFGMLIILGLLSLFSIFAVQWIHPISSQIEYEKCNGCSKGFQSVPQSMLTLYQQIVAGDSWGAISVPIVEESRWGLVLPFFQIVIGLGAMNLILAVIVDQAMEAQGKDRARTAHKKATEHKARKLQLLDLVRMMDGDGSGTLYRDEIFQGIQKNTELQTRIALCGLRQGELKKIIDSLASPDTHTPDTHTIGYKSFCNVLDDLDAADLRKTAVLTKVMLSGMQRQMNDRFDEQSEKIAAMSRGIEQIIDLHRAASPLGNTGGAHSQAHAENVKQEQLTASAPWTPRQRNCPQSISTRDLDLDSGKSITDTILSCRAEIDRETSRVQQSLMELDTRWSVCLRELEETLLACAQSNDSDWFSTRFLDHATRTHQTLERRRRSLFEHVRNGIEDDFGFWVCQCSFLGASDNVHAEHEQTRCEKLSESPCPSLKMSI